MNLHINTYGTYLSVKDAMFDVRKKQEDGSWNSEPLAVHKVTSILLGKGTALSTDAVLLAIKNNIDIQFVDWDGSPIGRVWHGRPGSTTRIQKRQLAASEGVLGMKWAKTWVMAKMDNQRTYLGDLKKHRAKLHSFLDDKMERIASLIVSVESLDGQHTKDIADTLRGLEGTAGRLYYEALSQCLPEEHRFAGRSFRPAQDPFNAMLNYAYGILYGKVERALCIAGLNPYVGFLHRDDYNTLSLVFDFIEPYRIYAEKAVFHLFSRKKVNKSHTSELKNGISLNKAGKELLILHFGETMDADRIRHNGKNQTPTNIIQAEAHRFANSLIV